VKGQNYQASSTPTKGGGEREKKGKEKGGFLKKSRADWGGARGGGNYNCRFRLSKGVKGIYEYFGITYLPGGGGGKNIGEMYLHSPISGRSVTVTNAHGGGRGKGGGGGRKAALWGVHNRPADLFQRGKGKKKGREEKTHNEERKRGKGEKRKRRLAFRRYAERKEEKKERTAKAIPNVEK